MSLEMSKPPFSYNKAVKTATISNQIEGYQPTKDKDILKEYLSLLQIIFTMKIVMSQLINSISKI